jgi:ATP-dependent DNA helicase RecG
MISWSRRLELLLNAVVHRDYKNTSDIVIKIFDDRIRISNPGRLYGNLTIDDLQRDDYVSSLRNRVLAEAFFLTGDIERYGTGFIRIREHLKSYPELELMLSEMGDFFQVELRHAPLSTPPINESDGKGITDLELRLLRLLEDDPRLSSARMANRLQIGRDTVKEYLGRLKTKKWLAREGGRRSGLWRVTDQGKGILKRFQPKS